MGTLPHQTSSKVMGGLKNFYFISIFLVLQGVFLSPIAGAPSGALSGQSRRQNFATGFVDGEDQEEPLADLSHFHDDDGDDYEAGYVKIKRNSDEIASNSGWKRDPYGYGLGKRDPYGYGLGKREPYGYGLGKRAPYGYGLGKRQPYGYGLGKRDPYGYGLGKRQPYGYGLGKRAAFGNEDFGKRDPYGYGLGKRDPYGYGLGKREPYGYGLGK